MGLSLRVLLQKQDLLTWIKWLGALILVGLFHAILLSILVLSCHKLCIVNVLFAKRYNKFLFFAHGNSSLRECLRNLHACESQLFIQLVKVTLLVLCLRWFYSFTTVLNGRALGQECYALFFEALLSTL